MKNLCILGLLCLSLSCSEKSRESTTSSVFSLVESMQVIVKTAPAFTDSCLPDCWPRVFKKLAKGTHYTAYLLTDTEAIEDSNKMNSTNELFIRSFVDSLSYPLWETLFSLSSSRITQKDLPNQSKYPFTLILINKQTDQVLTHTNDLGYLRISPVIINKQTGRGLYVLSQYGTAYRQTLIQVIYKNGQWRFFRQDILAIS